MWSNGAPVEISRGRFPRESDGWIWERYALYLVINRHVAEAMPDDLVSEHLQRVRENIDLPYDFCEL